MMTSPRLLLVEGDKKRARAMGRVLRVLSNDTTVVASAEEAPAGRWDLVLLGLDGLAVDARRATLAQFHTSSLDGRRVAVTSPETRAALSELLDDPGLHHILPCTDPVDARELVVTAVKVLSGDVLGVRRYFPWGTPSVVTRLTKSSDRPRVHDVAAAMAERLGLRPRLADLLCTICDELVTNAIYDAPTSPDGTPRHATKHRSVPVELAPGECVEVTLMSDGDWLACAARDPFGALTAQTVNSTLARTLRGGADQMSYRSGGAGLGLYTLLEASTALVVNVDPGRTTEVISLLRLDTALRGLSEQPRSIHTFTAHAPESTS